LLVAFYYIVLFFDFVILDRRHFYGNGSALLKI